MSRSSNPLPQFTRRQFVLGAVVGGGIFVAGCSGSENEEPDDDDVNPELGINGKALSSSFPLELFDPQSDNLIANVHWHGDFSHWHFGPLEVPRGDPRSVRVQFNDRDMNAIPIGPDETYQVAVHRTGDTPDDLVEVTARDSVVDIRGLSQGQGGLLFGLEQDGDVVWISPPLPTAVA